MQISDWISILTLIVVSVYTFFTYRLFEQQKDHFRLSLRPWIYPGDISFDNRNDDPKLAVLIYNFGGLPAMCLVSVDKVSISTPSIPKVELISINRNREFPIFPHVHGVDSVFMFFMPLAPEQRIYLMEGSKLEVPITIKYRTLTQASSDYSYLYSATLTVESFRENAGNQSTLIGDVSAT